MTEDELFRRRAMIAAMREATEVLAEAAIVSLRALLVAEEIVGAANRQLEEHGNDDDFERVLRAALDGLRQLVGVVQ